MNDLTMVMSANPDVKYNGVKEAADIMNGETIKDFNISPHKKYHVFSKPNHTVGIPVCTNQNFTQIWENAVDSMPKN